jgi:hypothetical protein
MRDGVFERWQAKQESLAAAELKSSAYLSASKTDKVQAVRKLSVGDQYPVAVLSEKWRELLGVKVQTVHLSDYDLLKQAVSRGGDTNFSADDYQYAQNIFDNVSLVVKDALQATVWFQDEVNKLRVAVLWQTKSGNGLYLKSLRLGNPKELVKRATENVIYSVSQQ